MMEIMDEYTYLARSCPGCGRLHIITVHEGHPSSVVCICDTSHQASAPDYEGWRRITAEEAASLGEQGRIGSFLGVPIREVK